METELQDALHPFAVLAGKLQVLEAIEQYYDGMRAYAALMKILQRMDDIGATFFELVSASSHAARYPRCKRWSGSKTSKYLQGGLDDRACYCWSSKM